MPLSALATNPITPQASFILSQAVWCPTLLLPPFLPARGKYLTLTQRSLHCTPLLYNTPLAACSVPMHSAIPYAPSPSQTYPAQPEVDMDLEPPTSTPSQSHHPTCHMLRTSPWLPNTEAVFCSHHRTFKPQLQDSMAHRHILPLLYPQARAVLLQMVTG